MAGIVVGTNDGVWMVQDGSVEELGLAGRDVGHVASRGETVLATVSHDGLYSVTGAVGLRLWDGDARACCGKAGRDSGADALPCSGDDGDFAFEAEKRLLRGG